MVFKNEHHLGADKIKYLRQLIAIKEKWATAFMP
jgi:hypothetical protein